MTMAAVTESRPWLVAGWTMLHFLWVGGVLGLAAAATRRALRVARPEVRYGAALSGLAALAAAPAVIAALLLTSILPGIPRKSSPDLPAVSPDPPPDTPTDPESSRSPGPLPVAGRSAVPVTAPDPIASSRLLATAATGMPGLWLVGAPATFALLATGLIGAERLRRQSRPLSEGDLPERCRRLAGALGLVRPVALGICDRLVTPVLLGVIRPMILLPASALTGWSPEQLEMALLHELAHVRRRDNLVNLVQRTIEAVLFFHPAVWWASAWVRLEREHCCDRLVVAHTGRARPYAELLAALALPDASPGRAAVAMAEAPVVARIRHILNPEDHPMRLSRAFVALVAGLLVAPAVLIAAQARTPAREEAQPPPPAAPVPPEGPGDAGIEALFRRAVHGAEMFQDVQGRAHALSRIAEAQARVGDRDAARRTFARAVAAAETVSFDDATYSPHILLWVARAQARAGFRAEAIATMRTLLRIAEAPVKNDHRKIDLFPNLVKTQAELGDEDGIRETLRLGRQFYTTTKERGIRAFAPQSLVRLQAMSGDLAGALRMAHDPGLFQGGDAGRQGHGTLFSIVGQIKANDQEAAGPILDEALRAVAANQDENPVRGRMTRNREWRAIAEAQARLGRFAEAVKSARESDAADLAGRMADPERFNTALTFALIGEEQAKAGDRAGARQSAEEVLRIIATIQGDQYQGFPLQRALGILVKVGDFARALQIADTLKPDQRDDQYLAVAAAQREAGDEVGARATLEAALRHIRGRFDALKPENPEGPPTGKSERNRLLAKIGRLQARLGDLEGAIATIRRINDGGEEIAALTVLARDRASVNDLDGALKAVGLINSPKSEAEALEAVVGALPRRGAIGAQGPGA